MAGVASQPSSSPSVFAPPQSSDSSVTDLLDCGHRSKDRFWLCVRRQGQPVAKIKRVCPACARASIEDTTGASGDRASDDANQAATTKPSMLRQELAVLTNSCRARTDPSSIEPRLPDGRAQSSRLEPFKTLLLGCYSSATDWVLGLRAAVAGASTTPRKDG